MSFALYRKYRPRGFEDLVGQSPVSATLLEGLKKGKIAHAFLFFGPRGTGKTSTARLIGKAIQCENRKENGEACGDCGICKLNENSNNIDLIEIDAASNRGIDDIRELREKIKFAPTHAKSKVYIIDEVHMLSKEAFNALLKSLEEPPSHVYFILATTEIHKIPETIISRCQRYDFKRIPEIQIIERLKYIADAEKIEYEPAAIELLAKSADGGMRDAISLLQQFSNGHLSVEIVRNRLGLSNEQYCENMYAALGSSDCEKGLKIIDALHKEGSDLNDYCLAFLGFLRNKLHEAVQQQKTPVLAKVLEWVNLFDEAFSKLKKASIATLPLEIAVIRACNKFPESGEKNGMDILGQSAVRAAMPGESNLQTRRQEGLIHIEAIKRQLPQVYKDIENVAVRSSFQTANLISVENKILKFQFSSKFHYDKVNSAEGIVFVENSIKKNIGPEMSILLELDAAEIEWEVVEERAV